MDALELGPDGKEWAKTAAGYRHVESVMREAFDGASPIGGWVWHGHSVREAFVAGAEWQEARADLHRTALDAEKARADAAEAEAHACGAERAAWKERAETLAAEREQLLSDGLISSDQREKYDRLRSNISVGKDSQQDAVNAIAALCRDNERLALLCGDRKARAEAAEAALKTAREEIIPILHLLEDGLTDFGFQPSGKFRTYVNAILAIIQETRT